MDDFFKEFKNNLENRPEPSYEDRLWNRLNKDMEQTEKKPKGGFFWWWAIPGMLLLASNIFLFIKLQKSNKQSVTVEIQRDTIIKTNVIYQTDTIYKTRIRKERILQTVQRTNHAQNIFDFPSDYLESELVNFQRLSGMSRLLKKSNKIDSYSISSEELSGFIQSNKSVENLSVLPEGVDQLPSLGINFLDYSGAVPSLSLIEFEKKKAKKTLSYYVQKLEPKGFRIGANGGWTIPFEKELDNKNGRQFGLQAYLDFSPELRMWFDASYLKVEFETERMDEALGVPEIPIPDDLIFKKAEVPQSAVQYSVGMQYYFNSHRKWKPFVGIGYAAVSLLPYEVGYEFKNEITGFEWDFEGDGVDSDGLITDFLIFQMGLERELNKNWSWQLKTGFRTHLEKIGFQSPRLFNVQTGVNYRFD